MYAIGNPVNPGLSSTGFIDWIRDNGRVTDGIIKGVSCDCENYRPTYSTTSTYKVYPDY